MRPQEEIPQEDVIDIRVIFQKIARYWYYYVICLVVFGAAAYFVLQYTLPTYSVSSTVLLKEEGGSPSEAQNLLKEFNLSESETNLDNEIGILQSLTLIKETLESLDLGIAYFEKGLLRTVEKYQDFPIYVQLDTTAFQLRDVPIYVRPIDEQKYQVRIDEYGVTESCRFGEPCVSQYFNFTAAKSFDQVPPADQDYYFVINDLDKLANQYRNKLRVAAYSSGGSLITLEMLTTLPKRDAAFLNALYETYAAKNLRGKNHIATRTIDFINSQLAEVSDSLRGAEDQLRQFRSQENVMDLSFTAASSSERLAKLESDHADLEVKLRYYNYLLDYLNKNSEINSVVAPSSIGIADPLLNELISELKKLGNEAVALNYSRGGESYELNLKKLQIENTKKTLVENVTNIINSTKISIQDLNNRIAQTQGVVNKLPENEQNLVRIQRKFNLSDNLYNYLLQKRAEAGITKASNLPDHRIIDEASVSSAKLVYPNSTLFYLLTAVFSFVFPTLLILIKEFLNDKLTDEEQVEKMTSIPILGKIRGSKNQNLSVLRDPRSRVAEDFRTARANLQFFLPDVRRKVIGVTSTVGGEGKTFFAVNFASTVPLTKKRVVLVEADLRKPSMHQYIPDLAYDIGLSNYLIGQAAMAEVVQTTAVSNFDIIPSGPLPPNPSELLGSSQFAQLLEELKEAYDYIVIDTPPTEVVSDYTVLLKNVDITLYVTRVGYSKLKFLKNLQRSYQQDRYSNIALVVNDVKQKLLQHYEMGYYADTKYRKNGQAKRIKSPV